MSLRSLGVKDRPALFSASAAACANSRAASARRGPRPCPGSLMLAARLMNSNMKLNVTSDFDLEAMVQLASGIRQPFGSMKKNAKASFGMSFKIDGTMLMKSAG